MKTFIVVTLSAIGTALVIALVLLMVNTGNTSTAVTTAATSTRWYLLVPPVAGDHCGVSLPLSQWQMFDTYASSAECHTAEDGYVRSAQDDQWVATVLKEIKKQGYSVTARALRERYNDALCLASDDPHLTQSAPAAPSASSSDPNYRSL